MKNLALIILVLVALLSSCTTTKGTQNNNLKEQSPYIFSSSESQDNVVLELKRIFLTNGWETVEDEPELGILVFDKALEEDEAIKTTAFAEVMVGVSSTGQKGRMQFVIASIEEGLQITMTPRLSVGTSTQSGFSRVDNTSQSIPSQGHPLPMKYGRILHESDMIDVVTPTYFQLNMRTNY